MNRLSLLPLLLLCAVCAPIHAKEKFSSLEERMSYKDFTGFGLDKLSPEQLKGLNDWIRNGAAADCVGAESAAPAAAPTAQASATDGTADHRRIESRIAGEFNGWQQGTILTLANGQRWEVRDDEPLRARHEHEPRVVVEPGLITGWTLTVEGHSEIAHVISASKH